MSNAPDKVAEADFESLVDRYYQPLYRFAFSLTRTEAEAGDLTQQTFYVWAAKGHQLRDRTKVKTWLFTTLYREFLTAKRHQDRFPHVELEEAGSEGPTVSPGIINQLDAETVVQALGRVEDQYQAPLALFYLEEHSYKEISEILNVPIGTVQSRIARGKARLQRILLESVEANKAQTVKARHG